MRFLPRPQVSLLLSVLCSNYLPCRFLHSEGHGKLTVFSVKAMLATMCGGKILDKLRCKYFQANQATA